VDTIGARPLSAEELRLLDAYWRAANYVSVGQIYLLDNPLLREPLVPEHVKPRLLGHWGTTPGLNFVYAHMNRAIRNWDLDTIYVIGPGHGGPAAVANAYLEGTYTEVYPDITKDEAGLHELFRHWVADRRGDRLKGGDELFTGEVWTGVRAQEMGLVDGLGTPRSVLTERFPDADLVPVEARKPLLARLGIGAPAAASADLVLGMVQAADIRATWARYGL